MAGEYGIKLPSMGTMLDNTEGIINADRMRKDRQKKTQETLKKKGIAAALLLRPENIRYATSVAFVNFLDRLTYCLAFAEHDPIYFGPSGNPLGDVPWIKPEQRRLSYQWAQQSPGPDAVSYTTKKFATSIKEELKRKGIDKEKLGIDDIDEVGRQALVDIGIDLGNVMPAMLEARAVKTQDEINCIHMVSVLVDTAHYAMYNALKPGLRERDVAAIGNDVLFRLGAESVQLVLVSAGAPLQGYNTDKLIQPGDVVTIDVLTTYLGYHSCCYRNYVMGREPTELAKDLHRRSYERMYKVINDIKPGVSTADLAKHWIPAKEKGWPAEECMWCDDLAHGMGLALYEYPICNRLWSLKYPQVMQKGMTMAVEAMEFHPLVGRTKLEEIIVVTDNGCEIFTRMPVKEMMIANPIRLTEV